MRNACRPMGRFFCLLNIAAGAFFLAIAVQAQTSGLPTTQVTDTVYRTDGAAARGTVLISWPAFTTADGTVVAAGSMSIALGNGGAFSLTIVPCATPVSTSIGYDGEQHTERSVVGKLVWKRQTKMRDAD